MFSHPKHERWVEEEEEKEEKKKKKEGDRRGGGKEEEEEEGGWVGGRVYSQEEPCLMARTIHFDGVIKGR